MPAVFLTRLLIALGAGFLAVNVWLLVTYVRYLRIRSSAVLTWRARTPPSYGFGLLLGVVLAILVVVKLVVLRRPVMEAFGELMMMLHYGYLVPLTVRIGRGFYEQGVWSDQGFLRYSQIAGISWRETDRITLLLIRRAPPVARKLDVPRQHYGSVRRLLRDRIRGEEIRLDGAPLDLGAGDERDRV